ncbi:MAG TPA: 5-(carboxyamino)imidazole ribonucleotide mutase [Dehalococcoidia bacterium]|nr:5-(carboxyamino)imidazole ribonucleotide mutase [Chloroflexota bacterium]HCI85931.1 5-(carboxyamino)imidazole ribonucleotide mutase [Dehalococcoidia bacterium]|tara:strand:+ start:589 stop:1089 length:501 start_codon:yes stop_codon:yes gene_type:complete
MAQPLVSVIMGSTSDLPTMQHAADMLGELGVPHEIRVISAHRTPDLMFKFAEEAKERGIKVIVASAGGAAHLPGMTAAKTVLPVIGVPGVGPHLDGMDSLMSMVQMPRGYPVGTVAIGEWGAVNAGILAAQIIGLVDPKVQETIEKRRAQITAEIESGTLVKPEAE